MVSGVFAVMLLIFLGVALIQIDDHPWTYDKKEESVNIVTLPDNSSVSEQFFLGSRQVDGTSK